MTPLKINTYLNKWKIEEKLDTLLKKLKWNSGWSDSDISIISNRLFKLLDKENNVNTLINQEYIEILESLKKIWFDKIFLNFSLKKLEDHLLKKWFIKIFEQDWALNKDWKLYKPLLDYMTKLYVSSQKKIYSYVFNIYFPEEGVYSFFYVPYFNEVDNRVYTDFEAFIWDIKEFLKLRPDEKYYVSIFSSKPGNKKWSNTLRLEIVNNVNYKSANQKAA